MITTTTHNIEGKTIVEYKDIVFGEIVLGINFFKDFKAEFTNFFGGRSTTYENELIDGRNHAIEEMKTRAASMGANAVVGVKIDYETINNKGNSMMMVIASGTAVCIE